MASNPGQLPANSQRGVAVVCLAVALVAAAGSTLPWLTGMDMMTAGYAIATLSAFVCLVALISATLFFLRARALDRILAGDCLLAHWNYDRETWNAYVRAEHRATAADMRARFFIVAAFAVVIGLGFLFFAPDSEAGFFVFLLMLALIAVIGVAAFLSTRLSGPHRGGRREAFISSEGILIGGALHLWGGAGAAGAALERVALITGKRPRLEFEYSYPTRYGRDSTTVHVPVPVDALEAAREIAARLGRADTG